MIRKLVVTAILACAGVGQAHAQGLSVQVNPLGGPVVSVGPTYSNGYVVPYNYRSGYGNYYSPYYSSPRYSTPYYNSYRGNYAYPSSGYYYGRGYSPGVYVAPRAGVYMGGRRGRW